MGGAGGAARPPVPAHVGPDMGAGWGMSEGCLEMANVKRGAQRDVFGVVSEGVVTKCMVWPMVQGG